MFRIVDAIFLISTSTYVRMFMLVDSSCFELKFIAFGGNVVFTKVEIVLRKVVPTHLSLLDNMTNDDKRQNDKKHCLNKRLVNMTCCYMKIIF